MYIIGASTLGEIACTIIKRSGIKLGGFFDDISTDSIFCGEPILGKVSDLFVLDLVYQNGVFVAIGDNKSRRQISERIINKGIPLINIIDPAAVIEKGVALGKGNLVMASAYLGVGTTLGTGNIVFPGVSITHHNKIGSYNFFSPNASIGGFTQIGDECKVAMNCCVLPYNKIASNSTSLPCTVLGELRG